MLLSSGKKVTLLYKGAIVLILLAASLFSSTHIYARDSEAVRCINHTCSGSRPADQCAANWVYTYGAECVVKFDPFTGNESCFWTWETQNCNATDTCAGGTGLKAGLCSPGGCTIGGDYKVCCNGLTPVSCSGGQYSGTCGGATTIIGTSCTGRAAGSTNGSSGDSNWCAPNPPGWETETYTCPTCTAGFGSCTDVFMPPDPRAGQNTCTSCDWFAQCTRPICRGTTCDRSCPERNCRTDEKTGNPNPSFKEFTFDANCAVQNVRCEIPSPSTRTVPNPAPACGWYDSIYSNSCADLSLPIDWPPNIVITRLCNECVFPPSSICGAQRTCGGRLNSCGGVLVTGEVWERTGTAPAVNDNGDPYTKSFIYEPLQPLRDLLVQVVSSSHPTTCTSSNGTYSCTVTPGDDTSRHGTIKIRVSALGYAGTDHELRYSAGDGSPSVVNKTVTQKIYVDYLATTNASPGNWTQVKGASYVPRGSGATTKTIMNVMPIAPTRYDTNDAVPSLTNYAFNTGTDANGAVTTNAFLGNYTKYSVDRDWHIDGYPMTSRDVTSVYLQYVTKRKLTTYSAAPNTKYTRGSVILVPNTTTLPVINDDSFIGPASDGGVLFLVGTSGAPGAVTLGGNITTTTAVGIIANGITVSPAVSEIDGVFAANTFDTGAAPNQGLKIVGNLSVVGSFTNNRKWRDTSRPSVYVQYDIGRQLGLLKNLSIATSTSQQEE